MTLRWQLHVTEYNTLFSHHQVTLPRSLLVLVSSSIGISQSLASWYRYGSTDSIVRTLSITCIHIQARVHTVRQITQSSDMHLNAASCDPAPHDCFTTCEWHNSSGMTRRHPWLLLACHRCCFSHGMPWTMACALKEKLKKDNLKTKPINYFEIWIFINSFNNPKLQFAAMMEAQRQLCEYMHNTSVASTTWLPSIWSVFCCGVRTSNDVEGGTLCECKGHQRWPQSLFAVICCQHKSSWLTTSHSFCIWNWLIMMVVGVQ